MEQSLSTDDLAQKAVQAEVLEGTPSESGAGQVTQSQEERDPEVESAVAEMNAVYERDLKESDRQAAIMKGEEEPEESEETQGEEGQVSGLNYEGTRYGKSYQVDEDLRSEFDNQEDVNAYLDVVAKSDNYDELSALASDMYSTIEENKNKQARVDYFLKNGDTDLALKELGFTPDQIIEAGNFHQNYKELSAEQRIAEDRAIEERYKGLKSVELERKNKYLEDRLSQSSIHEVSGDKGYRAMADSFDSNTGNKGDFNKMLMGFKQGMESAGNTKVGMGEAFSMLKNLMSGMGNQGQKSTEVDAALKTSGKNVIPGLKTSPNSFVKKSGAGLKTFDIDEFVKSKKTIV